MAAIRITPVRQGDDAIWLVDKLAELARIEKLAYTDDTVEDATGRVSITIHASDPDHFNLVGYLALLSGLCDGAEVLFLDIDHPDRAAARDAARREAEAQRADAMRRYDEAIGDLDTAELSHPSTTM